MRRREADRFLVRRAVQEITFPKIELVGAELSFDQAIAGAERGNVKRLVEDDVLLHRQRREAIGHHDADKTVAHDEPASIAQRHWPIDAQALETQPVLARD